MEITAQELSGLELQANEKVIAFLKAQGRIFQQPEFLYAQPGELKVFWVEENGVICGALPLVLTKRFKIHGGHIPPYAHFFGPILDSNRKSDEGKILSILLDCISGLPFVELKIHLQDSDILEYVKRGALVRASQSHIVLENQTYDLASIHPSKRRYLKKLLTRLEKGDLRLTEGDEALDDLISLQKETGLKSGFNPSLPILKNILENLSKESYFALVLKTGSGELLSGAFCPFDRISAYHIINASLPHADPILNRSNILSTFLAVKKANDMGLNFDFEGSNIPGVANFYRMMGGQPFLMHRIQFTNSIPAKLLMSLKNLKS